MTAGYMTTSALMLISNKLAIHRFPSPFTILFMQLFTSWFVMFILGFCVLDVTPCSWNIVKRFWPVPGSWLVLIFAGLKAVQYANVETFIVFRATTPIILSFAEWLFLGRKLPNLRSTICLVSMTCASVGYTLTDSFFQITGYMWIVVWYTAFLIEFLVVKHKVDTVDMTNWVRSKGHLRNELNAIKQNNILYEHYLGYLCSIDACL